MYCGVNVKDKFVFTGHTFDTTGDSDVGVIVNLRSGGTRQHNYGVTE